MSDSVVLFGEMLWDCLPTGAVPGGAPMNVALHLHQLGLPTRLISAVGKDADGEKLLDFLRSFNLPLDWVQVKEAQDTSKVVVDTRDPENIRYDILKPVAWDFLEWSPRARPNRSRSRCIFIRYAGCTSSRKFGYALETAAPSYPTNLRCQPTSTPLFF